MSFFKNLVSKIKNTFSGNEVSEQEKAPGKSQLAIQEKTTNASSPATQRFLIDANFIEELEERLIKSDLGVSLTLDFSAELQKQIQEQGLFQDQIPELLKDFLLTSFDDQEVFKFKTLDKGVTVMLVIGVNGVGKTTSIGKLANYFKKKNKKVLIAAGDTFRAAAESQLKIWADRAGVGFFELEAGSKPSAVVFKAIEKVKNEGQDFLIIDTAGRLHNKQDLMEELKKIKTVISKNLENVEHRLETMLVLDASTGQNALSQAEAFSEACDLDSIILTKFDGSAKAGVVFSIARKFKFPVKFVGTGEAMDDIAEFVPEEFTKKYL